MSALEARVEGERCVQIFFPLRVTGEGKSEGVRAMPEIASPLPGALTGLQRTADSRPQAPDPISQDNDPNRWPSPEGALAVGRRR